MLSPSTIFRMDFGTCSDIVVFLVCFSCYFSQQFYIYLVTTRLHGEEFPGITCLRLVSGICKIWGGYRDANSYQGCQVGCQKSITFLATQPHTPFYFNFLIDREIQTCTMEKRKDINTFCNENWSCIKKL